MVSINCGAIPESTVESELFGHEKGAFTGAETSRPGKFELATDGTLFLDEVGEVPLSTQVKLLRALEQQSFYRVGGEKPVKVDVRIVAATNSDLAEKERLGTFRSDLLFRLKVFVIQVPPLRERTDDIPDLIRFFLDRFSGDQVYRLSSKGLDRAMAYHWPGNVRELCNVLEREVILAEGAELHLKGMDTFLTAGAGSIGPDATLKEAEKAHIVSVLRATGWNKKAAAEILGIGRPTIYDKIKQLGIREGE
jgi:DNA-binding NtrC family response regulator